MVADHGVREVVITGTQADVKWFVGPIRYENEDGHAMQRSASLSLCFAFSVFAIHALAA
jgi:hypothetical protein